MDFTLKIAKELEKLRSRGITIQSISEKTGFKQSTVWRYLYLYDTGKLPCSFIEKLANSGLIDLNSNPKLSSFRKED